MTKKTIKQAAVVASQFVKLADDVANTLLKNAVKAATSAQAIIHEAAMQGLIRIAENGDSKYMTELVNDLSTSSQRTKSLIKWVEGHTPFVFNKEKKFVKVKDAKDQGVYLQKAFDTPFWKFSLEAEPIMLNVDKLETRMTRLIKELETALDENRAEDRDIYALSVLVTELKAANSAFEKAQKVTVTQDAKEEEGEASEEVCEAA